MPCFITLVPLTPGTDDGSASVAALTETLRALLQHGNIDGRDATVYATLGEADFVVVGELADDARAAAYAAVVREQLGARETTLTALDVAQVYQALGEERTGAGRPAIGRGI